MSVACVYGWLLNRVVLREVAERYPVTFENAIDTPVYAKPLWAYLLPGITVHTPSLTSTPGQTAVKRCRWSLMLSMSALPIHMSHRGNSLLSPSTWLGVAMALLAGWLQI
ncbi:hypothetical protein KIPB_011865, partial [Kipferlia bialata]|eukprot:g11865.t1